MPFTSSLNWGEVYKQAMAFEPIRTLIRNIKRFDESKLINLILSDKKFQEFIIRLNTEDQLFKDNINSLGIKLSDIGGDYSPVTIAISSVKGRPKSGAGDVNLKDTGDFYNSFEITLNKTDFVIDADPIKEGGDNLFDRWGEDVLGLTDENLQLLIEAIQIEIIPILRQKWFKGV